MAREPSADDQEQSAVNYVPTRVRLKVEEMKNDGTLPWEFMTEAEKEKVRNDPVLLPSDFK
jgi:hypothetical protein